MSVLGVRCLVEHSGADPRWHGPPDRPRIRWLLKHCFQDIEGQFGPWGVLYIDGAPVHQPTEAPGRIED